MPSLFVIGHLKTAGGPARQTVINALTKTAEYSAAQEPGVYKFCVTVPREDDDKSVIAIEEYADQAAMDKHMVSPPVKALLEIFAADPALFAEPPAIYGLPGKLQPAESFTRSRILGVQDPMIIFANFEYEADATSQAVKGWKDLVRHARDEEQGTLSYTVLEDVEKGWVRTVEAYESREFLEGVHVKSAAVGENQRQNGAWRTGRKEVWRLRMVAGYLHKEDVKE